MIQRKQNIYLQHNETMTNIKRLNGKYQLETANFIQSIS